MVVYTLGRLLNSGNAIWVSHRSSDICRYTVSHCAFIYLFISHWCVGEISTRLALDREHQSSYQLVVVVQDSGTPPRSATGTAFITVLDENDNAPFFTRRDLFMQVQGVWRSGSPGLKLQWRHGCVVWCIKKDIWGEKHMFCSIYTLEKVSAIHSDYIKCCANYFSVTKFTCI